MNRKKREKKKLEALEEFAKGILKKYRNVVKSIWFVSKEMLKETEEGTVIILFDDTKKFNKKLAEAYVHRLSERIKEKYGFYIHPRHYLLSDYWTLIKEASPVTFCEIREGIPLYDPSGFFVPLKKLLEMGKIPGTKEAIRSLVEEAPERIEKVERRLKADILFHLFNACVESGQAALILLGVAPPIPKKLPKFLRLHPVKKGMLKESDVKDCEYVIRTWKDFEHGKKKVEWEEVDKIFEKTARFVEKVEEMVERLK